MRRNSIAGSTRRRFLTDAAAAGTGLVAADLGLGLGLGLPLTVRPAAATPDSMRAAIRNVVGEAPVRAGRVKLDIPPLVESGNTVSLSVSVESPMTAGDYVKAIHVFNEKNPQPNVVGVRLTPRAGRAGRGSPGGRDLRTAAITAGSSLPHSKHCTIYRRPPGRRLERPGDSTERGWTLLAVR